MNHFSGGISIFVAEKISCLSCGRYAYVQLFYFVNEMKKVIFFFYGMTILGAARRLIGEEECAF